MAASAWLNSWATDDEGPPLTTPALTLTQNLAVGQDDGLGKSPHYVGDDHVELSVVGYVLAQDHELVAPHAGDGVDRAYALPQARAHGPQQPVADVVAGGVVHGLEVVEVEEHDPDALAFAPAPLQRMGHAVLEQAAVGQAGEVVVHGLIGQRPLRRLLLCDVADHLRDAGDVTAPVAHRGQADGNLDTASRACTRGPFPRA